MLIVTTEQKLIPRYQDKIIINPGSRRSPITKIMDITELNSLLDLNKERIPTTLTKLRKLIAGNDGGLYDEDMIVTSEKYEFTKNKYITKIKESYNKAKYTCELKSTTATLPRPTTTELEEFAKLIKELEVTAQPLPAFKISSDIIMTGNGNTLMDVPDARNYYNNMFYLSPENVYEELTTDNAQKAEGDVICLVDKQQEKLTKYHMSIFKKNSKMLEKILTDLLYSIKDFQGASAMSNPPIARNVQKYPLKKEFKYLDHCLSPYNIYGTIFDPEELCIKQLKKIHEFIQSHGDVLNRRKPLIINEYEEIRIDKMNTNTLSHTIQDPMVTSGTIYEFINTYETFNRLIFPFFLFDSDKACSLIQGLPEVDEERIIIRNTKPLSSKCCYSLLYEGIVEDCIPEKHDENFNENYLSINTHNMIISYYVTIGISIIAFIVSICTTYFYLKRRIINTNWYKLRQLKKRRKKEREARELNEDDYEMRAQIMDNSRRNIVPRFN